MFPEWYGVRGVANGKRSSYCDSDLHLARAHAVAKILRIVVIERALGAFRVRIHEVAERLGRLRRELRVASGVERYPVHFPGAEERLPGELDARIIQRQ